jgi:hypothetical protein
MTPKRIVVGALALAAGFGSLAHSDAASAQSPKLYEGSLILHYFGNDMTSGSIPPFDDYVFTALPLGARCNPAISGGMTCDPAATLQVGAPLTGSAEALVGSGSPASIVLLPYQLARITSGSLPPRYASQVYQNTYANVANAFGSFGPGEGPGSADRTFGPTTGVRISRGKNQFGGVMRLLRGSASGALGTKARYSYDGKGYVGNFPSWGVSAFGATNGPGGYTGFITGTYHSTINSNVVTAYGNAYGWRWTTGTVSVYASGDHNLNPSLFPEHLMRAGYDNRSPNGGGTIQLVTPHLTSWGVLPSLQMGAIGVLRLKFVPEPRGLLLLLSGSVMLGLLHRRMAH